MAQPGIKSASIGLCGIEMRPTPALAVCRSRASIGLCGIEIKNLVLVDCAVRALQSDCVELK